METSSPPTTCDVSIILPVYNASKWLDECLSSVCKQSVNGFSVELSVFNDGSTDDSLEILDRWRPELERKLERVVLSSGATGQPRGVGYAKNRAVEQSCGHFLCFQDADDAMHPERITHQLSTAQQHPHAIVGCRFHREPEDSTSRYSKWANTLDEHQLYTQAYTSHGPTVIMPTWFMSRRAFEMVGCFDECGKGTPEDLIFFYKHLEAGGSILRVELDLLMYRYHPEAQTFSVLEHTIWELRVDAIQRHVISKWSHFCIWNAGKQGRRFFRSLSLENQRKVTCFCDVDAKKISKQWYTHEESKQLPRPRVPIVHFSQLQPPVILCVKQDLTEGGFEHNLSSLNLKEGVHFYHFN